MSLQRKADSVLVDRLSNIRYEAGRPNFNFEVFTIKSIGNILHSEKVLMRSLGQTLLYFVLPLSSRTASAPYRNEPRL